VERDRELPEYLPARMVNEFVYCPRLFFYEWVEGLFEHSVDTVEGSIQHRRVDRGTGELAAAEEGSEKIHARSVTLSSERLKVIAKLDLVEAEGTAATPIDYKHGKPKEAEDGSGLELWAPDRVQLVLQAIILRENGYSCDEAAAFYQKTRQRVRVEITPEVVAEAEQAVALAWDLAARGTIPAPLVDSPKCAGCSLHSICLPDETNHLIYDPDFSTATQLELFEDIRKKPVGRETGKEEIRLMMTPRDDLKPLYLNTPGLRVGKSGEVLQVKDKEKTVQEIRVGEICQVNLLGNIQISTQAVQVLCESGIPVSYFTGGGWFYGITSGMNKKNINLRRAQFRLADSEWFARSLACSLVAGKIRNQRVMMQRNHLEPKKQTLAGMKSLAESAEAAESLESLLGYEGTAARYYFEDFAGMIKVGKAEDGEFDGATAGADGAGTMRFDFEGRNRRPPRDPVNALLSLAYSMLAKDLTIACYAVGFDPYMGYFHQTRHGRPSLALDLMEPFRPLIADSAVLSAINTRMVTERDFVRAGESVALTTSGRKGFYRAYEARMDSLVTHPLFDYRVSYRRLLEIQVRLLARVMEGEIARYPVFVTR